MSWVKTHKVWTAAIALAVLLVVLTGVGAMVPDEDSGQESSAAANSEPDAGPDVDWTMYGEPVKQRIDDAAEAKDCDSLQQEFDTADSNGAARNADLMTYIDWQLEQAGCY